MTAQEHGPAVASETTEPRTGVREGGSTRKRVARPYVPLTYTCGGCDNRWSGVNRAHCSACHRTFAAPKWFDQHRVNAKCVDPETIMVTPRDGSPQRRSQAFRNGVWSDALEFTNASELFGGAS